MDTAKRHSNAVDESGSTIDDVVDAVREVGRDKVEQVKNEARDMKRSFDSKVREQPMKSVLMAFGVGAGVGVLVAYMLRRR